MLEYQEQSKAGPIRAVNCYPYAIPFRQSFASAHGLLNRRTGAIIEVLTEGDIRGIGEIAPLPEFRNTSLGQALQTLSEVAVSIQGKTLEAALTFILTEGNMAVRSGLELALLDAIGRDTRQSIGQLLSQNKQAIKKQLPINAVVGARENRQAVMQAHQAVERGFFCIKLKMVGSEQEQFERIDLVRAIIGNKVQLRLDANEGWDFEQARRILRYCEDYDIQYVEQPLPVGDVVGMKALQQETTIPLAADEAVDSLRSAYKLLAVHYARVFILKPQLCGGFYETQKIIEEAEKRDISCVITSSIESGIGLMGAVHLAAASPSIKLPSGLGTLDLLVDDLVLEPVNIVQGLLTVPMQGGSGITLDRIALQRYRMFSYD